jgi:murein DD-endopeptidase MepM/ murein hydrolase activator NlpD
VIGINKFLSEKNIIEVITVNKNKFTEFFKGKGYYVLLFVGVLAIAAVAVVGSQLSSNNGEEEQNFVNLNDTDDDQLAVDDTDIDLAENDPITEGIANLNDNPNTDVATNDDANEVVESNGSQVELEGYETPVGSDDAKAEDDTEEASTEPDAVETTGDTVETDTNNIANNLSFTAEDDLLWPVNGNVIMNYSMDHTIYFATLKEHKVNPAVIIDAEVGTEVKAAANGVVTSVETNNEETGFTVTMNIGGGYSLVYGQLDTESVDLEVGDAVEEGSVIGTIGNPTKYYSIEGSNLYFQVLEDDQIVNPMLYLE